MMTRSSSLLSSSAAAVAIAALAACGSVATSSLDGGAASDGGTTDAVADADAGAECEVGGPSATFELRVVGDAAFCDSSSCDGTFVTVRREDGTPVAIDGNCVTSCSDCRPIACAEACRAPASIGPNGVTKVWQGSIYETSTCGAGTQCARPSCAAPGTYVARMCAYKALPDAGTTGVCAAMSTPTCTEVTFTWPPTEKVIGMVGAL